MKTLLGVIGLVVLIGCSAGDVGQSQEGLTLFTADAQNGISGMYQVGDRVVFFETIRTGIHPEGTENAGLPELSVRFADQDGRTLASLSEADGTPAHWSVLSGQRLADVVVLAMEDLDRLQLDSAVAREKGRLIELHDAMAPMAGEQAGAPAEEVAYTTYRKKIKYWYKTMKTWLGIPYGNHSTSATYLYIGGVQQTAVEVRCNHGNCPNLGNTPYCSDWGPELTDQQPVTAAECATGYAWHSVNGKHNCNDDIVLQRARVIQNRADAPKHDGWGGECSDGYTHTWAPYCACQLYCCFNENRNGCDYNP